MSRLALYRKWRPMTFRDVVEQRHVVDTLRNAIRSDAIGHAYLFCGTRGTGKTTMAKIFSRAVNCLNPREGDPCNECSVCRGILDGSILDVVEMDAASNNSVDNIRDIRDEVVYAPAVAKYKVYIIDEVHMLSSGAFNALLKTLEEPPDRVVFILATTEPQKLPATVLSRCQRFDFKRITENGIAERLGEIAGDCGITVTSDALLFLARLSGGALRDAISLLDQLTTLGRTEIDIRDVNEMAGFASNQRIRALAGALEAGDIQAAWLQLDTLMREGRDLSQLCVQLLAWYRNVLLLQLGGDSSPLLDIHPDDLADAKAAAVRLGGEELAAWLRELSEHELRLRRTDNPRILMEVLLLRLCTRATGRSGVTPAMPVSAAGSALVHSGPAGDRTGASRGGVATPAPVSAPPAVPSADTTDERLNRLERQMADLVRLMENGTGRFVASQASAASPQRPAASRESAVADAGTRKVSAASAATMAGGVATAFTAWPRIIDEIRRSGPSRPGGMKLFAYILDTECVQAGDDQLRVVVSQDDLLKRKVLSQSDSLAMMAEAAQSVTGQAWQFKIIDPKEAATLRTGMPAAKPAGESRASTRDAPAIPRATAEHPAPDGRPVAPTGPGSRMDDAASRPDDAGSRAAGARQAPPADAEPGNEGLWDGPGDAFGEERIPSIASTGDEALDRLLDFGRETGIPIVVQDEEG